VTYRRESASDLFDSAEQLDAIRGLILEGTPIKARIILAERAKLLSDNSPFGWHGS
jgi:hypothetical protein